MEKKKALVVGLVAVLAVAFCATASSLIWVCRKVRAFEAAHGGSVYANLSKAQLDERVKAGTKAAATNDVPQAAAVPSPEPEAPASEPEAESVAKPKAPPPPPPPTVRFAAPGRYLPSGGARAIGIEAVNVTNVYVQVCRVVPANVVQLLAREEGVYSRYEWDSAADQESTEEISGEAESRTFACVNRPDEKETFAVPVRVGDGGGTNGIFLVAVRSADRPREDSSWVREDRKNLQRYRLVCLSDLGLSVRMNGTDSPGVWVTSLMKGTPIDGVRISAYSSANIKVMEGETDENGWSRLVRVARGEPFAIVAETAEGDDSTFVALRDSMEVDESYPDGCRGEYLSADAVEAFLWTERGIYRHGEKIMFRALMRNGRRRAPPSMPVELRLVSPKGDVYSRLTVASGPDGLAESDAFSVPADQPSGTWRLEAKIPGEKGRVLGARSVKVEEFAPPQIRVGVEADGSSHPSNFAFTVSGEHLFGGAAHALACEGAVVFEDVSFAPAQWKGWSFGNEDLGLKPNFRELRRSSLDRAGKCVFAAPLWADSGLPRAAVRATGQGTVFEDGGRPATARATAVLHYYPYYVGSTLCQWTRIEQGLRPRVRFACVKPDGSRLGRERRLVATLERIESVYSYRRQPSGWETWDCEKVRRVVASDLPVVVPADEDVEFEIPTAACGDYALTVTDRETGVSFGKTFYLSDWGDASVSAPMSDPTAVALTPDKAFYRVGETPRIRVRSPFAGHALVSVLRDRDAYTDILALTNATSEIELRPVTSADAPNLDVYVSVVQSVEENARHMAARAHGQATVCVRPVEDEIPVQVAKCDVAVGGERGSSVSVAFEARGASAAVVTVVDEGINILTDEPEPDPVGFFAAPRQASHPLYDIYHRILPVLGEDLLRASGVKTGGGAGAEMLGRVSPVPTRRFKPLALWSGRVDVGADGKGECRFDVGEFVGEVRATVVAWSESASGAASVHAKVTPKIVAMPDAPRFAAPGDVFEATLPIYNRSGEEAKFGYSISVGGNVVSRSSIVSLAKDEHTNIAVRVTAPDAPGELDIVYTVRGMGERHEETIRLPVRPAVAWVETAGVRRIENGKWKMENGERGTSFAEATEVETGNGERSPFEKYSEKVYDSPIGEYESALRWLAEYPHGCLEQTTSRVLPLVGAGGLLASVSPAGPDVVVSGVRRVESMVRSADFVMWPDCSYAPWDREVSLYASQFLIEAEKGGCRLNAQAKARVTGFLKNWAMSTNDAVSVYACHNLALAGRPERDRMLRLYDASTNLTLLSRARLARAFALAGDRRRAEALLASSAAPSSVKEASFAVLALLDIDPGDPRILPLVDYLNGRRDRERLSWGTTGDNAHALLAIGSYYRHHPAKEGDKFVSWRRLTLPEIGEVKDEFCGISVSRRFLTPEGGEADLGNLARGELLIAELSLRCDDARELSDLVVEDLFPACFEPVHGGLPAGVQNECRWVMRSDARDDRMLVFSKKFTLGKGEEASFRYPLRVVSAGEYTLPGPSVEAMYFPGLRSRRAPSRLSVSR